MVMQIKLIVVVVVVAWPSRGLHKIEFKVSGLPAGELVC